MITVKSIPIVKIYEDSLVNPLTLEEVKNFLRVDGDTDNDLITKLIKTATKKCETYIGKSLITKKYKLIFEDHSSESFRLPYGPVQSIESITIFDFNNNSSVIDSSQYIIEQDLNKLTANILISGHKVEILYTSGYGATASDVPDDLKQGILFHIARLYDDRGGYSMLPNASIILYNQYKNIRL